MKEETNKDYKPQSLREIINDIHNTYENTIINGLLRSLLPPTSFSSLQKDTHDTPVDKHKPLSADKEKELRKQLKNILIELRDTEEDLSQKAKEMVKVLMAQIDFGNYTSEEKKILEEAMLHYLGLANTENPFADITFTKEQDIVPADIITCIQNLDNKLNDETTQYSFFMRACSCAILTKDYNALRVLLNDKNKKVVSILIPQQYGVDFLWAVNSFLISPIQRLPKLPLLLKGCVEGLTQLVSNNLAINSALNLKKKI